MNRFLLNCLLAVLGIVLSAPAWAVNVTISGQFRPTDPTVTPNDGANCGDLALPYQIVGPLTTNVGGTYIVQDSGNTGFPPSAFSQDSVLSWYSAMPDLGNLAANRLLTTDDDGEVNLQTGTNYYVLAQPYCGVIVNGVWGQLIRGPGTVSGEQVATTPAHWQGTWSNSDGLTNGIPAQFNCPETYYDVNGPITLETSGTWYVSVTSGFEGRPISMNFYDAPFDPDNPYQNQVASGPGGRFDLEAGDYYIVTHGDCDVILGDWFYVMWPPHPFEMNSSVSAAYREPATTGSGILLDVNPDLNYVFGAWFTWATPPAAGTISPQAVGNDSQRWLTFQGTYTPGDTLVELMIYSSSGGVFDDPAEVTTVQVGTATLDAANCNEFTLTYSLESGESGDSTMSRVLPLGLSDCENSYSGPGVLYE